MRHLSTAYLTFRAISSTFRMGGQGWEISSVLFPLIDKCALTWADQSLHWRGAPAPPRRLPCSPCLPRNWLWPAGEPAWYCTDCARLVGNSVSPLLNIQKCRRSRAYGIVSSPPSQWSEVRNGRPKLVKRQINTSTRWEPNKWRLQAGVRQPCSSRGDDVLSHAQFEERQVHIDPQLELLGCVPYRPGRLPLANFSGSSTKKQGWIWSPLELFSG